MTNIKEKAKKFWKENKKEIVVIGVSSIASGLCAAHVSTNAYHKGLIDGGIYGIVNGFKWLEETIPETKAWTLYEEWKKANPDKLVNRKGPGKWA